MWLITSTKSRANTHSHTHRESHTCRHAHSARQTAMAALATFLFFAVFHIYESRTCCTCVCAIVCVCVRLYVCVWVCLWLCLLTSLTNCQITRNSIKNLNFVRASSKAPKSRQQKYAQMAYKTGCCCYCCCCRFAANKSLCKWHNKSARNEPIMYKA